MRDGKSGVVGAVLESGTGAVSARSFVRVTVLELTPEQRRGLEAHRFPGGPSIRRATESGAARAALPVVRLRAPWLVRVRAWLWRFRDVQRCARCGELISAHVATVLHGARYRDGTRIDTDYCLPGVWRS